MLAKVMVTESVQQLGTGRQIGIPVQYEDAFWSPRISGPPQPLRVSQPAPSYVFVPLLAHAIMSSRCPSIGDRETRARLRALTPFP
jgi:hypothetical protein